MYSLNTRYSNKIIHVDSSKASAYLGNMTSAFSYDIEPVVCSQDTSIILSFSNVIIPYSFYGCAVYNNKLDVIEMANKDDDNQIHHINIIIPPGNYNAYQLANEVEALLNTNSFYNISYTIAYDKISNKYSVTIHSNLNNNCKVEFLFMSGTNSAQSCRTLLGFSDDKEIENNNTIKSDNCIILNLEFVYLKCNIISDAIVTSDGNDGIISVIPVNCLPNSIIYYEPLNTKFLTRDNSVTNFNVSLTDKNNNIVDLNGLHLSFCIELNFINNDQNDIPYSMDARNEADEIFMRFNNPSFASATENLSFGPDQQYLMKMYNMFMKNKKKHKKNKQQRK